MGTDRSLLRSVVDQASAVLKSANEPARRFRLLWNAFALSLVGVFGIIGAGYVVGGAQSSNAPTIRLLINIEFGSYRVHGTIMVLTALLLLNRIGSNHRESTRWALRLFIGYSALVATMIFGGWIVYDVSFAAPWWYVYALANATILHALAPSVLSDPAPIVGDESGSADRGESA